MEMYVVGLRGQQVLIPKTVKWGYFWHCVVGVEKSRSRKLEINCESRKYYEG